MASVTILWLCFEDKVTLVKFTQLRNLVLRGGLGMWTPEAMTSINLTARLSATGCHFSQQKPDSCAEEIHFVHLLYKQFEQKQL